ISPKVLRGSFNDLVKQVESDLEIGGSINGQSYKFRLGDGRLHCIGDKGWCLVDSVLEVYPEHMLDKTELDHFPFEFNRLLACKQEGSRAVITGVSSRKLKVTSINIDFADVKTSSRWSESVMRIVTRDRPDNLFKKKAAILLDEREPAKVTREAFQKHILPILQASGKEFDLHTLPFTVNAIVCISARPKSKDVDEILRGAASRATVR
ncbi:hypothetical protein HDU67_003888, partial [Dinochytrium kinnereticum]